MDNSEKRKKISVVTPCFNEEANIVDVHQAIKEIRDLHPQYDWEHLFIDNASIDRTVTLLKEIAAQDKDVKVIVNIKNFGIIRSPYHGYLSAEGDAVIVYMCDLQDPPELISDFVKKWEEGHKLVVGVKNSSEENPFMFLVRKIFYAIMDRISETDHIKNFTGFGLYDKSLMDILRTLREPFPFFRGLVVEYGENRIEIPYTQRTRKKGKTKNNFYTLYDSAMGGFVANSKVPLRLANFLGFGVAFASLLIAFGYLIYKLVYWDSFQLGAAPLVIGMFFLGAVQLIFIGIIGEYVGAILTEIKNRPLVIEKERINFD